jgi:hypothetical protein
MPDFVHMHHPDVDACAEAPEAAFEAVWAELGWTAVEPHDTDDIEPEQAPVEPALEPKHPEASAPPPAPVKADTAKEK